MRNIVDIFREAIEGLGATIAINSVNGNGNGTFTLMVSETKWIRPKSQKSLATKVAISAVEYDVDSMVYNTSVTVSSAVDLSAAQSFTIAAPVYLNGTQLAVQKERGEEQFAANQNPFVWLVEPFVTNENRERMSIVASEPDITLLFLDNQNPEDWTTADHYSKVILAMDELIEAFYLKLKSMRATFGKITKWNVIRHADFGEYGKQGHYQRIINENTSGTELQLSIEIFKTHC